MGYLSGLVTRVARENWLFAVFPAVYMGAGLLTQSLLGKDDLMQFRMGYHWFHSLAPKYLLFYFSLYLLQQLPTLKKVGFRAVFMEVRVRYLTLERILGLLIAYFTLNPFFSIFSSFKVAIPMVQPFAWDEIFMKADWYMHFGHHPWELIHPILAKPVVTKIVDRTYFLWFYLLFGVPLWMACTYRRRLRIQFFLSFMLTWIILGTLMATLLSSAGPCYYDRVTGGENPFASLMEYLQSVHQNHSSLFAIHNQVRLWDAYETGTRLPFADGISAMPSLHVAIVVLYALLGWRTSHILGALLTFYSLIVLIGSVHLGWHYAVDGYLSIILTILIWRAVGHVLDIHERRREQVEDI
jgi:hypothetical protein